MSFTIEKEVVVYIVFNFGLIEGENHRFSTVEVNTKRLSKREIGGIFQPFKKWTLKDLAVPKHFLCKPVDPLAESLDCSQAKKGGPRYITHLLIATKKTHVENNTEIVITGGTSKHTPISDCSIGNWKPFVSKASNNGTLINLVSSRKHFEIINSINQMDQNVTINNLLRAARGEASVTLHDLGVNNFLFL
ncbi:hypothetical protein DAPPUDRAFT_310478 [Daphnia pulex]|uniref:Uncharacterized protein n=1 Tax=Daphnia pulex TaxID=6669 RepID=E9FTT1_DAPPU|nr:hypothetical protein DAPPUDRAFT_310478 [Daphnia pulex]|eukprot:EFX89422.1 hypothetical protein DAPPUDRAFT_310478 [Daphnia pulex]